MVLAVSNAVALYANKETTWNETPSSASMRQLRFTGESLTYGKKTVTSETIRSDRMRDQLALVSFETKGDINHELAFFDDEIFMEGAMFSTFQATQSLTGTTFALTSTAITDSGNGLGKVPVNSYLWLSGATNNANNIRYRVTAVAAGSLTLSPAPAATQSAGPSMTLGFDGITVTMATTTLTIVVAGSTITFGGSTGYNPTTSGLAAGQWVRFSGFAVAANNGIKRISSITATTIVTVSALSAETCTNGQVIAINGRRLRNGTTQQSYHIQKAFTDIGQYLSFRGMTVSDMKMDLQSSSIIKGSYSFMGAGATRQASTWATSTQSTNTSPVMTASANVGTIAQNGASIAVGIKQIQLSLSNNLRALEQIGSTSPLAIGYGFADVTGQVEAYFQDSTLYDQLINNTTTELSWPITDDSGNVYVITIPSVIFTDGFPNASAGNTDIMLPLNYHAIRNSTYNCELQIDQIPVLT